MTRLLDGDWNARTTVEFVQKYVEEHYMDEVILGDLALVAHVSPSYLSTRFKKETGASFTEYLIRYRVNKAKNLLKEKQNRCREVAENVGYKDYAQFSKIFKKYVGVSPKEYQRMALEEEN